MSSKRCRFFLGILASLAFVAAATVATTATMAAAASTKSAGGATKPATTKSAGGAAKPASATKPTSAALPVDSSQEKELKELIGTDARVYRTGRFLIASNSDAAMVRGFSNRLERTFDSVERFCKQAGFETISLDRRLEVLFFDKPDEYKRYGKKVGFTAEGSFGFYYEGTNISAFFNIENDPQIIQLQKQIEIARTNVTRMEKTLASIRDPQATIEVTYPDGRRAHVNKVQAIRELEDARRELKRLDDRRENYCDRINLSVLQHELAHQVFYNIGLHVRGGQNPKWLVEGLACLFETPPSSHGAGIGVANQDRLRDFRSVVAGKNDIEEIKSVNRSMFNAAIKAGRLPSLEELITKPELFEQRGNQGAANYAMAWAMMHYLNQKQTKALRGYLQAVAERKPGQKVSAKEELELFEKHFGPLNDTFTLQFSTFILNLPFKPANLL